MPNLGRILPMRRVSIILLLLVHCTRGGVLAHVGERVFPLYELTDYDVGALNLHDGRTDDWFAVVGEPTATSGDFECCGPTGPSPWGRGDLDFRVWLAWHRSGKICGAVETSDDTFVNKWYEPLSSWDDSSLLFGLDADHGGEPYQSVCFSQPCFENLQPPIQASNRLAQAYYIHGVTPLGASEIRLQAMADRRPRSFADQLPFAEVGGGVFSESPVITVTEFCVTAFNDLEHLDPAASRVAHLEVGQIVGIAFQVNDQDNEAVQVAPTTFRMPEVWCCMASTFADGLLLPPYGSLEEEHGAAPSSWARIKAAILSGSSVPQAKRH